MTWVKAAERDLGMLNKHSHYLQGFSVMHCTNLYFHIVTQGVVQKRLDPSFSMRNKPFAFPPHVNVLETFDDGDPFCAVPIPGLHSKPTVPPYQFYRSRMYVCSMSEFWFVCCR